MLHTGELAALGDGGRDGPLPFGSLAGSVTSSCACSSQGGHALDVHRRALRKHRKQVARIVVDKWIQFTAPSIRARRHFRRKLLLACVLGLGREVLHQRAVHREMLVLRSRFAWQRLHSCLAEWRGVVRDEVASRLLLRGMHAQLKKRRISQAFQCWTLFALHLRSKRRQLIKAAYFRAFMLKSKASRALQDHLRRSRTKAWNQAQAVYQRSQAISREALAAWAAYLCRKQARRAQAKHAAGVAEQALRQRTVRGWHAFSTRRAALRLQWVLSMQKICRDQRQASVALTLRKWQREVSLRLGLRRKHTQLAAAHRMNTAKGAVRTYAVCAGHQTISAVASGVCAHPQADTSYT